MRMRTFTAPDMNRAMLMIRETMGDGAVIISTARDSGGKSVSVTAAVDEEFYEDPEEVQETLPEEEETIPAGGIGHYLAAKKRQEKIEKTSVLSQKNDNILHNRDLAYLLNELEQIFHFHSVPLPFVETLIRSARQLNVTFSRAHESVYDALVDLLSHLYRFEPLLLARKPERIMLIGTPGCGKTLVTAKVIAQLATDDLPVRVVTIDNKRAGGVEQLRAFTAIMGIETEVAETRAELRQLLRACPPDEPMVIDTFGTNPYSFDELKELTDFANLNGVEAVLVMAAGGDAQEAADVTKAFSFLGVKRLVVTRVDTARRMGAVMAAAESGNLALANMTATPRVAGGLEAFSAASLGELLMHHKEAY